MSNRLLDFLNDDTYLIGNDIADGNTIIFHYCDEGNHLQDFLGLPEDYIHS